MTLSALRNLYILGPGIRKTLVRCENCGKDALGDARFCPSCGVMLRKVGPDGLPGIVSLLRHTGPDDPRLETLEGVPAKPSLEAPENYVLVVNTRLQASHKDQNTALYAIGMGDHLVSAMIPQITCEAVGGKASEALDLACAFSLGLIAGRICDDIMDRTIERNRKRTVWREFGDPVAIPLAFRLISEMFETLSAYDTSLGRVGSDRIARTFRSALVDSARSEEHEKLSRRSNLELSFRERVKLAEGKRGALIAAGTMSGGIVGRGTEEEIQLLRNYGIFMGTANQLFDDSNDPDYPESYRKMALSESRDLAAEAVKCTDRLRPTGARQRLRDLCRKTEVPLL